MLNYQKVIHHFLITGTPSWAASSGAETAGSPAPRGKARGLALGPSGPPEDQWGLKTQGDSEKHWISIIDGFNGSL